MSSVILKKGIEEPWARESGKIHQRVQKSCSRGVIRTIECHVESCTQEELREDTVVGGGARRVETVERHLKDCKARSQNKNLYHSERRCWLGVRNNSAECFVGTAEGVLRARELRRIEHQDRWDKEAINHVIGVSWRFAGGTWTVDRPVTQTDPLPPPPVPLEGARGQRERISRTVIETFGTTAGCLGLQCDQIWKASTSSLRPLWSQE